MHDALRFLPYVILICVLCSSGGCTEADPPDLRSSNPSVPKLVLSPLWSTTEAGNDFLSDGPFIVRLSPEGQIFVADRGTQLVHQFDTNGTWQATAGGPEGGPSALQFLVGLNLAPNGRVLAIDGSRNQVMVWDDPGAAPLSTHRFRPWQSYRPFGLFVLDACAWAIPHRESPSAQTGADVDPREYMVRYACDTGAPRDTLFSYPGPDQIVAAPLGGIATFAHPHGRKSVVRYRDGLFYEGHTSAPEIRLRGQDGHIVDRLRFDHSPVPIEKDKLDAMRVDIKRGEEVPPTVASALLSAIENAPHYDTHPVFDHFAVDTGGRLWIQPVDPSATQATWQVVDRSGETVAQAYTESLPVRLAVVRDDRAYGIRQVDDGEHQLVAFAIAEE